MSPRGILKSSTTFPLEHELRARDEPRTRSRSRDRRHADEALQLVVPSTTSAPLHREQSGTSSQSSKSRRSAHSRRRSRSRSRPRRHVRWSDPIEFVVSDGQDMLSLQLRHRRSSLPGILEDTRTLFRESLREQGRGQEQGDKDARSSSSSAQPPSSSSSSHKRPALKPTLSTPNVGSTSRSSKSSQVQVHAPAPITREHRKRRTSLPNGLEAALRSPSHALWLPHHADHPPNDHPSPHSDGYPSPQPNANARPHHLSNGHSSHHSNGYSNPAPQTPRRYEPAQLPPHAHEQPHLRGAGPPPPVTFTSQQPSPPARPASQLTTSTHRSSKSSPPEKRPSPLPLPAPPVASPVPPVKQVSPVPSAKQMNEPPTPRSTKSSLFALPTIDDIFSKDETSHSMMSIRRLFGLSTPKHEPRKLDEEDKPSKKSKSSKEQKQDSRRQEVEQAPGPERRRASSFVVHPPPRESLHRARHSFDLGTFSLLDDMHMRWTAATARHFLPVLTPAEIQASHLTLSLNPGLATLHWDIRHPPNAVWSVLPGRKTTRWTGHNEPATVPLVPSLRIISPYFPWVISARNPAGVTCGDVLSAIHASARQLVWRGEFESLRTTDKNRLAAGYYANRPAKGASRSAESPFESGSWLVRADWLGHHTVLSGISASETRDQYGAPADVLLSMYLAENKREEGKGLMVVRH